MNGSTSLCRMALRRMSLRCSTFRRAVISFMNYFVVFSSQGFRRLKVGFHRYGTSAACRYGIRVIPYIRQKVMPLMQIWSYINIYV